MVSLGVAFRSRPVEQLHVLVVEGPLAESIQQTLDEHQRFRAEVDQETSSRERLRTGKIDLVISADLKAPLRNRPTAISLIPRVPVAIGHETPCTIICSGRRARGCV